MIVDASVAMKWLLAAGRTAEARALLSSATQLSAPRFILLEVAHVLWRARRRLAIAWIVIAEADAIMSELFSEGASTDGLISRPIF